MQAGGQSQTSILIIEAIAEDAAGVFYRNICLAQALYGSCSEADAAWAVSKQRPQPLGPDRSLRRCLAAIMLYWGTNGSSLRSFSPIKRL
jgi:hypothetical protein